MVKLIVQRKTLISTFSTFLYENVLFNEVTYESSNQDNEGSYDFIDTDDESSSKDPHKDNQDFTLQNSFTNSLFQFKEVEEFNNDIHISPACMISFDNDRFKGIPMHLNPLFSPLEHDNYFPDKEVVDDDFVMLEELHPQY
jgi:hypothetical protein